MKKYLNEGYFGLLFGTIGFIYFSYSGLTRERIKSENDLTEINGQFSSYSFKDRTGYKRQAHEYYFWIDNYNNAFQIKADYLGIFKAEEFVINLRPGDDIKLTISKAQLDKLNTDKNVFVTSIKANRTTYLNNTDVLKIERSALNLYADFFLAGGALIVGLIVYIRKR